VRGTGLLQGWGYSGEHQPLGKMGGRTRLDAASRDVFACAAADAMDAEEV
jgi:hypothetical protein